MLWYERIQTRNGSSPQMLSRTWMINLQHNNTQECESFERGKLFILKLYRQWRSRSRWWEIKGGVLKWDWSMCTHKSTNRIWVYLSYRTKVLKAFYFNCKIEKRLYVFTLSGLEEWGLLFNSKGTCSLNQIMNLG